MIFFAALARSPKPLLWTLVVHVLIAAACAGALACTAPSVMGVHPALKPFKFATSIALFLATMGLVLPVLAVSATARDTLAWVFAVTMAIEMGVILLQALRGTTSHFNLATPFDALLWRLMMVAIVVATVGIGLVTVVASVRPLDAGDPLVAFGWRLGLWLLMLSPVSGFAMGGRLRHSVGGEDGGPGLPLVNWSIRHGDLRVAHFVALHAVQLLPAAAWLLARAALPTWCRNAAFGVLAIAAVGFAAGTLVQAFAGRPFLALRRT